MYLKATTRYRPYLLLLSIAVGLSVMYSIYFFNFKQGEIDGGTKERLLQKLIFMLAFSCSLCRFLDFRGFFCNLIPKIPVIYLLLFSLVGSLTFLEGSYVQAINFVFFVPVLFINWDKLGGDALFRYIWKAITLVVIMQLIADPMLKAFTGVRWDNNALVGGMGNPNVYGLFLLVTAVYLYLFSKSFLRMIAVPLALLSILTGSLVCALIAVSTAGMIMFQYYIFGGYIAKIMLLLLGLIMLYFVKQFLDADLSEYFALTHAVGKIEGLLSGDAEAELGSVEGRMSYIKEGIKLMEDNPLSLIFGHPDYLAMFNGDGTWISFIVTHGIPFTFMFLLANLYAIKRSYHFSGKVEFLFSFIVLLIFQLFFVTNRILDYWPTGLIYLLVFSYCVTRDVRTSSVADALIRGKSKF